MQTNDKECSMKVVEEENLEEKNSQQKRPSIATIGLDKIIVEQILEELEATIHVKR